MTTILKTIQKSIKHWYLPLIIGIIFILIGLYTFNTPLRSYLALTIVFSISFLISGISEIAFSISNRHNMSNWGWTLSFGILDVLVGILLISRPEISMQTLPFFVGFLVMFRSFNALGFAIDMKQNNVGSWGYLLTLAILGILFAFILLWNPVFAGLSIVIWTGIAFVTIGIFYIILSFKLKKLNTTLKDTEHHRID